ncbi:HPr kinase/phosphorylase [Proteiniclasticum sp. BAD-10]|uniref:HPr kinase/phosphorylase n=1 Tax=Proteiniclasticum sediminis TaxID=2804028 RepID=A0A941HPX6_9CLOT|nr:HPr(Ser) kinase/phosphatase [Proteiniclasticum sediminis]MBR0575834.1 HPr kinase/phosphorylase [Proteiniclasticum sediminis]
MSVKVKDLIKDFDLEVLQEGAINSEISINDINRPGLQLAGFYNYFSKDRVQVIGMGEWSFLDELIPALREKRVEKFLSYDIPCIIITRNLEPHQELRDAAKRHRKWVLRTKLSSTTFISRLTMHLSNALAPETRLHGTLVDIYGMGVFITGDSGIGKSEATLELLKRGHRLVADDAVDIRAVDGILRGRCPEITFGMMEVRGLGIIDVSALYGLSTMIPTKRIDFIIHLEHWRDDGDYDRLGMDEFAEILGVKVKKLVVPVRSGRNISIIIEAAAANYRYSRISKVSPADVIDERMREISQRETEF